MEHLGQQKERLSERLKQRQEQELDEVEKLAKAVFDALKNDLQQRVNGELNTTVTAIKNGIEGLPKQITDSTEPLREVLEQAQSEGEALKLVSKVWLKALLIGVCTAVGIGLGSWAGLSWLWGQIEQEMGTLRTIRQEIYSAQSTLDALPKGVSYIKGKNGKGHIVAPSMGTPFEWNGKMAVEVN